MRMAKAKAALKDAKEQLRALPDSLTYGLLRYLRTDITLDGAEPVIGFNYLGRLGLPAIDGVELVRRLRQRGVAAPVLILTARAAVADRVEGLDAGAQDYLVKPFEVDELLARLRALLRRTVDEATELDLGGRRLDVTGRRVVGGGQVVDLSGREAALLEVLARRPQQVFTRPQLLAAVFDPADDPGSVDTYVYYLRRKLGRDCVTTVHGVGYRLGTIS